MCWQSDWPVDLIFFLISDSKIIVLVAKKWDDRFVLLQI